jgi:hypothetical protein
MVRALGAFQLDGVAGNKRRRKPKRRCFFVTDHVCRGKGGCRHSAGSWADAVLPLGKVAAQCEGGVCGSGFLVNNEPPQEGLSLLCVVPAQRHGGGCNLQYTMVSSGRA